LQEKSTEDKTEKVKANRKTRRRSLSLNEAERFGIASSALKLAAFLAPDTHHADPLAAYTHHD
jgi:hypothetical protein